MAVLLVACPCAMGLATPVAVWGGLARLTRLGLVARTGDFLDVLSRVDTLCIDKTGTLSVDTLSLKAWRIEPAFREREAWLKVSVAAVEEGLSHPIAEALREKCHVLRDTFPKALAVTERRIVPGHGVVACVEDGAGENVQMAIGEAALGGAAKCHVIRDTLSGKEVYVFVDGELAATVELAERWREGLSETLSGLRELGIEAEVLSGDLRAAEVLGHVVAVRAGLTPEQKLARVEELASAGRTVLFVGDGINDAAAMSAAHGSIAMRGGADLARASSMAVFVGDDLRLLPLAIVSARAARRSIRTNLLFAAAYNVVGMALAAAGMLHPVAAALLMLGSSVFVSVNSLRAGREAA
jgi:cation transport ATPase